MKLNKKLALVFMIILCCMTLSVVSAENTDNITAEQVSMSINQSSEIISDADDVPDTPDFDEEPDFPDLNDDDNRVTPTNIQMYFHNGVLKDEYKGKLLTFTGNFDNLGVLSIKSSDVSVVGSDATFKNTVFDIESNGVILKNLTFILNKPFKDNYGAAIMVNSYDVSLIGLNITYNVPNDVEAYAIYADGSSRSSSEYLKIINSTIYFEGHNDNLDKYNCAIKVTYAYAPIIENNTIISSLPLKDVKYGSSGATLDSDFVYSIGLEECPEFILRNNTIIIQVNKRPATKYPTLSAIMISKSDDGLFANNTVYMSDFVTYPGTENYLYGLDIYNLNNLKVLGNKISIVTTGGKLAMGTAYPIQICGPVTGVNITKNDLYSYSNGPNIGIYSQNFYGETELSITNNKINVTGLAGTHEWALVTGIESQDSQAEIHNNTIEVHSIAAVSEGDNLYAISYRQSTAGSHTYDIRDNIAFTDGYYGIYLLSSDSSKIINNILVSSNEGAVTGSNAYAEGSRTHNNDISHDNIVYRLSDYYNSHNTISMGQDIGQDISNHIQWTDLSGYNQNIYQNTPNYNPLIPYYSNTQHTSSGSGNSENSEYIDDGSVQGSIDGDNNGNYANNSQSNNQNINPDNEKSYVYSKYIDGVDLKGFDRNSLYNNSDGSPALDGDSPLDKSRSSGSTDSRSVSKSYEIEKIVKESEKFIPSIFFIIAALILLIAGYKLKNSTFSND